jgi:chaperone modulatory protein CbpM
MNQEHIAVLVDEQQLSFDELLVSCSVSREWVIEHVQAGVLQVDPGTDLSRWRFTGRDLLRTRRLCNLERDFDANPELAGLVADLCDELERLRTRLRRVGLHTD